MTCPTFGRTGSRCFLKLLPFYYKLLKENNLGELILIHLVKYYKLKLLKEMPPYNI
jgi:hypothetical protein